MESKKFLFVSIDALASDIAWRITQEGHEVKYFIEDAGEKDIADGFLTKVDDWKKEVEWADIVVFDDVLGQGKKAAELRKIGKLVVGGTPYTDRLEDDRAFGQEELKNAGIATLSYRDFTSFDDALQFIRDNPDRYVLKPSGDTKNLKLFVGEEDDGRDLIQLLEAYKKAWTRKPPIFQLQKRIIGVEVAVGAFFNGTDFVYPVNVNFEHKKLFPSDIGPFTGEMGTSMFWSDPNKIFNATLKKMEGKLREEHYVGYIDINCIVNSNGIYPLEFTARFGYPTIYIQHAGMLNPISEFLYELAEGKMPKLKVKSGFQVGVRIVAPPFPFRDPKTFEINSKDTVIIFKKPTTDGIYFEDVKLVNGEWVIAGTTGAVLVAVGTGPTMKQARAQAYSRISNVIIPNMYYRDDIGERWADDSDRLHTWGYLRES